MTRFPVVLANGQAIELARYHARCDERRLLGQRVEGRVRVTDVSSVPTARRYLVDSDLSDPAELAAVVADYLEQAAAYRDLPHAPPSHLTFAPEAMCASSHA
jgi:hypothetical protein